MGTHKPQSAERLFFARHDIPNAPPWLIDDVVPAAESEQEKPKAAKKTVRKKATPQKPKLNKAKAPPKPATSPRRRKPVANPIVESAKVAPPSPTIIEEVHAELLLAPLPRAVAPVIWQKNGPIAALRYWLRSASRNIIGLWSGGDQPAKMREARLRTRKELLLELAVLRQENAIMRQKLQLPAMPLGRVVADQC